MMSKSRGCIVVFGVGVMLHVKCESADKVRRNVGYWICMLLCANVYVHCLYLICSFGEYRLMPSIGT